jgi:hypothetical protein
MAQSIVSSLFGVPVDPIERIRMTEARGPEQAISGLISGQGASLRQNVNRMFGVVPPQEKLQQIIQQASQQVDLGTPEGMSRLADALAQHPEFAGMSMGLKQEANNMRMKQSEFGLNQQLGEARLGLTKAQTEAVSVEEMRKQREEDRRLRMATLDEEFKRNQLQKEEQLRKELAALGENATEEQYLRVVTKYGSPDKIIAALQSADSRRERMAQQRDLALQRIDIARQNADLRREAVVEKKLDKEEARKNKLQSSIGVADNVIAVASLALNQTNGFTAGMLGKPLSVIGVPDAVDLEENLKTIQANLGFKELQQMRDNSPTGGALGQVALKELEFLQAALTSLSNRQSPSQLKKNLEKVVRHYSNWKKAVSGEQDQESAMQGAAPTATQQPVATRRFNPATGQIEPIR